MQPTLKISYRLALLLPVVLLVGSVGAQSNCPKGENYAPCTCSSLRQDYIITCTEVPMRRVKAIFTNVTTTSFLRVLLTPATTDAIIPIDVLSTKQVTSMISIICPNINYRLNVNANALRNAGATVRAFEIRNCDLTGLDFAFLRGFSNVDSFYFDFTSNIQSSLISELPSLPKLTSLNVAYSYGLDNWTDFPVLSRGLTTVIFNNNYELGDQGIANILNWLTNSSTSTLSTIWIRNNQITKIPELLNAASFPAVNDVMYDLNSIPVIKSGSVSFSRPVQRLDINAARVETIEPGAFIGDFTSTPITLTENKLTRFEEAVFKGILTQMINATGFVDVRGNPFDCMSDPCHLAWLLRDHRELLPSVKNAACSDGKRFDSPMCPTAFAGCPITTLSTITETTSTSTPTTSTSTSTTSRTESTTTPSTTTESTASSTTTTTPSTTSSTTTTTPSATTQSTTSATTTTTPSTTTESTTSSSTTTTPSTTSSTTTTTPSTTTESTTSSTTTTTSTTTSEPPSTTTSPTETSTSPTTTTTAMTSTTRLTPTPPTGTFACPADGVFPAEACSGYFYVCTDGVSRRLSCRAGFF